MELHSWKWKPDPDYNRLLKAIRREGDPQRVPFLELFADQEIVAAFLNESVAVLPGQELTRERIEKLVGQRIRFWYRLGYDAFWQGPVLDFPSILTLQSQDTAAIRRSRREWVNEKAGVITTWEDFEEYPWPRPEEADYYPLEYAARHLPDGMGLLAEISGIYEPVSWLMGYETLGLALYESPDLVEAMFERVREIVLPVARTAAQMERVIGIWMGDDLGFKTGTLVSPRHLRQHVFPIQKEIAGIAHAAGMPFLLHSCGNLSSVMADLIDDVGIDARHSFEDVIEPVESFCQRYNGKLAVIGGVDVDLMARGTAEQVRRRTRQVLQVCAPGRAYILGSGNSIANYIPLENFLVMVDEGWQFNTSFNR